MPIYHREGWPKNKHRIVVFAMGAKADRIFWGGDREAKIEEARLKLELEATALSATMSKSAEGSFYDLSLKYRDYTIDHVKASTWGTRKFHVANLVEYFHVPRERSDGVVKALLPSEIDTFAVDGYVAWRKRPRVIIRVVKDEEIKIRKPGAKGRTINNELKTLRNMRTYALDHGLRFGAFKSKPVPEIAKGRLPFWTHAQIGTLYDACMDDPRGRRLLPVLVFLANTGCRKGEAIHAERRWVQADRLNAKGEPAPMLAIEPNDYWQPKSGLAREVPISDALLPFVTAAPVKPTPYLFLSSKGRPYRWFPNKTFRRLVEKAGLSGGPHMLRHSFASAFLRSTPDMFLLSQLLGHSHEKVTKDYAHLLPDHLEEARNAVNLAPGKGPAALEAARRWAPRAGGKKGRQ